MARVAEVVEAECRRRRDRGQPPAAAAAAAGQATAAVSRSERIVKSYAITASTHLIAIPTGYRKRAPKLEDELKISWRMRLVLLFAAMRYRVGEHVLDLRKFELRKNDCLLPAEPQVLSLLFLLVENRDRLVSKDELVATIWGGRAVSDSAISSRIKSARQLLGDDGEAQRLIRTVHGKGFRFVGEVSACEAEVAERRLLDRPTSKPSIAVLPFDCTDPRLSIISDGVPHDLIVGLSRLRSLTVIARGSSFRFRGWSGDLAQVGATIGRDLLSDRDGPFCGQSRRRGRRTRRRGDEQRNLGRLYQGDLDELHEVRESILAQIICTLELQISHHEAERARLRSPEDLDAWSVLSPRLAARLPVQPGGQRSGPRIFRASDGAGPAFSQAHAGVSFARFQNAFMQYSDDIDQEVDGGSAGGGDRDRARRARPDGKSDDGPIIVAGRRTGKQRALAGPGNHAQPQLRAGHLLAGLHPSAHVRESNPGQEKAQRGAPPESDRSPALRDAFLLRLQ